MDWFCGGINIYVDGKIQLVSLWYYNLFMLYILYSAKHNSLSWHGLNKARSVAIFASNMLVGCLAMSVSGLRFRLLAHI